MRDKMFEAISSIIAKHHNTDYDCAELMAMEDEFNATIYTLDARDLRLATNDIIDLITDFFIKGSQLVAETQSKMTDFESQVKDLTVGDTIELNRLTKIEEDYLQKQSCGLYLKSIDFPLIYQKTAQNCEGGFLVV